MVTDAEKSRTFYWDGNVSAMSESRKTGTAEISEPDRAYEITPIFHYYLQDDLGSPLRVSGYNAGTEGKDNGYLTYGYDEFGNDLYEDLYNDMEDAGIPNPYSRQGEEQPFGYTGYRHDDISGTYFAQAREYQPQNGRFTAEDVIKGNGAYPDTLNQYGYCLGNPMVLVDNNGKEAVLAIIATILLVACITGCSGPASSDSLEVPEVTSVYSSNAGTHFEKMDDAAEDFARTMNGISIEEGVEYGAFIYS